MNNGILICQKNMSFWWISKTLKQKYKLSINKIWSFIFLFSWNYKLSKIKQGIFMVFVWNA